MEVTLWPLLVFTGLFVAVVAFAGWVSHGDDVSQDDERV